MSIKHEPGNAPDYLSYLVRLWRVGGKGGEGREDGEGRGGREEGECGGGGERDQEWKASLEEPITQRIRRFEDLQSLFKFLQAQIGQDNQ